MSLYNRAKRQICVGVLGGILGGVVVSVLFGRVKFFYFYELAGGLGGEKCGGRKKI